MVRQAIKERRTQVFVFGGVALSVLLGFIFGGGHLGHFDASLFATAGAAFGTTVLAYATWTEVGNGWAREWAAQRPLLYPRLPDDNPPHWRASLSQAKQRRPRSCPQRSG